ncbi:unnamed protein product [Rotaria magnacalcarata]|uniref:Piwi-like protein 1 n=2 Tax=Rotaria magnacalcarata TaxID=392030 RepID=A0A815MK79_9BILA|nr:unnamed protein product [Rotaria magnacalcarata]
MDSVGRARGRGRANLFNLTGQTDVNPRPGAFANAAAAVSSFSATSSASSVLTSTTPTEKQPPTSTGTSYEPVSSTTKSTIDKPRRGNAPVIMSAPRGKGVEHLVSDLATLSTGDRQTGSGRGTPWSNIGLPKTKPSHIDDKRGVSGDPISIVANYIRILSKPAWQLFQYHIDFNPEEMVVQRKMRREMVLQHKQILKDVAFDGTTLYSFEYIGDERTFECQHTVTGDPVEMRLRLAAKNSPDSPNFFHLANLIVRKLLELSGLRLIGRNYYQFDHKVDLERYRLTLFPGFLTNVNIYEGSLMINVDLSHKVLNKTTVFNRLQDIFTQFVDFKRAQDEATKELVGQIVLTTYNSKTYKIDEIAWDKSPNYTFKKRDGTDETLVKYYYDRYQLKIEDTTQPLLISKPSKKDRRAGQTGPLMLIPELCCVTGISDVMRSDFQFMKELATHTHIGPMSRFEKLTEFCHDIQNNQEAKDELKKWEISIDTGLVEFDGRLLESEQILYANRSIRYKHDEADWSREGRSLKHISCKNLKNWIVFYPSSLRELGDELINALYQVCVPFGMEVEYPTVMQLPNDRPETYLSALPEKIQKNTDLVLCVLPNNRKDRYDALKKYMCLDNPVPSQMVLAKTISKKNQLMSVATKIGIQLNAKLGGEIWGVTIPSKTLMVIGMDSYHDSKRKGASVGAFVASTNVTCTRFYSRVIYNRTAQELMDGLQQCMRDSLKEYHRVNNTLPEKIVLYRDGVSDGQLAIVAEHELPQIIDTFPKIMPGYQPKLAVVIVKKKGNARFFAKMGSTSMVNPPPGTIIDHTVTNAEWYDFYLISQCARQGTVAPTHYNIIWDRTNFKVDHMQRLTFKLTHLYYNWPGTIRVPAVCQYAHKLAFLVGQSLHQDFNPELADRLFYL